jgi:uncharacterized protein YbjQ (UPF0145 family)
MKLLTTNMIDETKYESLGLVQGISIQSLNVFRQIVGNFKAFFGARQGGIEKKYIQARQEAIQEMVKNARELGADEVIGINVEASQLSSGGNDGYLVFTAEGTAVAKKGKRGTIHVNYYGGMDDNKIKGKSRSSSKSKSKSKSGGGNKRKSQNKLRKKPSKKPSKNRKKSSRKLKGSRKR